MDFSFTDDDDAIRDAVRAVLRSSCTPEVVRAAWSAPPCDLDRSLWKQLDQLGVGSMLVSEANGGLGFDERATAQVLEEVGYAGAVLPVVETMLLAPALLTPTGGTLFASDLGGARTPMAADADVLLLGAPDGSVHAVPVAEASITPRASVDGGRRLADVYWTPTAASMVCDDPDAIRRALDRARFGTAAVQIGVLQRLLDMTVEHVAQRRQFGVPIGSFQAVKHHLADALMWLSFARPMVHRAAWSLATGDAQCGRHVALAKLLANQATHHVTRQALQCHGAIGYTVEYDLHLFLKRAWALGSDWGTEAELHRFLSSELGLDA